MVEKMTAVWLIVLTILVCAAVPGILIWISSTPADLVLGFPLISKLPAYLALH